MSTQVLTPVGRIVWGHPLTPQIKTDQYTKQPILDKDGNQTQQWVFGLAIPEPEFNAHVWPSMAAEIQTGYPQGVPSNFSYKYKRFDSVDKKGIPYSQREGYVTDDGIGCIVLAISTELQAPGVYKKNAQGTYVQLMPDQIKRGDYVRVDLNLKVNVPQNSQFTPGLYVNPVNVEHMFYGEEITSGPSAEESFAGAAVPANVPAGASLTPIAPAGGSSMPMQQQPMQQQPMQQQPMQQQPMQQQPQGAPGTMPPPANGFANQQQPMQQQPQGAPGTMPPR